MSDTQWPRYEVFQQDRNDRPHQNVGSVHAVDAEMAMQNARDVFVRRPQTINLWVAPADEIMMVSANELETHTPVPRNRSITAGKRKDYAIFRKTSQRQSMTFVTFVGNVTAESPQDALSEALNQYGDTTAYVWWVCPEDVILKSSEEEIESMFEQAHEKHYRMPRHYRLMSEMMELKRGKE